MSFETLYRHRHEIARALANFQYERSPRGLYFPRAKLFAGGVFAHRVNDGDRVVEPNIASYQGLDDLLSVYLKATTAPTGFYIAPFSANVSPVQTLTGANFTATMTEFTNYSESTRTQWVGADVASQATDNSASPARFTIGTGGGTVWGAATIANASAKSATTGKLLACSKFDAARVLSAGDKLDIEYAISAVDDGE